MQPILGSFRGTPFWLAHNGNLVKYQKRRNALAKGGYRFRTHTDTEFVAALIDRSDEEHFEDAFLEALLSVEGTYSMLALYKEKLFGMRDPSGNRPLVLGEGRGLTVLASESATCDVLNIQTWRDVEAGELVVVDPNGGNAWYSERQSPSEKHACIFESVYFQRPDSIFQGQEVTEAREQMGRYLWREHPVEADIVVPVLDSGLYAALGLAGESGIPWKPGLFRSHYVGRTFIAPLGKQRAQLLNLKFNPIRKVLRGKRVIVVDDSIVRASAIKRVVRLLRRVGVKEIHVRISSPPYMWPCYYGIDTYRVKGELIAPGFGGDVEAIRRAIGADSLGYLSLGNLTKAAAGDGPSNFCDACFSGNYPISIK